MGRSERLTGILQLFTFSVRFFPGIYSSMEEGDGCEAIKDFPHLPSLVRYHFTLYFTPSTLSPDMQQKMARLCKYTTSVSLFVCARVDNILCITFVYMSKLSSS
jgi:hypothetical protein